MTNKQEQIKKITEYTFILGLAKQNGRGFLLIKFLQCLDLSQNNIQDGKYLLEKCCTKNILALVSKSL